MPIYCVTHRRGESVHAFVASCGTTLPGNQVLAYFEDEEERVGADVVDFELHRQAPRVLNNFTLAQPAIDTNNRYRQHILAMEKRLVTTNWSFRFFTTLFGILVTNTFFAHRYWNNASAEFKVEVDKLALAMMNNPKADSPTSPEKGKTPTASARTSPCEGKEGCSHTLQPLREFLGPEWKQGKQLRCVMCNSSTSWVCKECSEGALQCVPICPSVTTVRKGKDKGKRVEHACLCKHVLNPTFYPRGKTFGGGRKRKAASGADGGD